MTVATEKPTQAPDLRSMSGTELDALYRASPPGKIPVGPSRGTAIALPGSPVGKLFAGLVRAFVWKGKIFDPKSQGLKNLMSPLAVPAIRANVYEGESWFDGRPCIVLDYARTSTVARWVRDEIREVAPGEFLGVVYLRRRKLPVRFRLSFAEAPAT